MRKLPIGQRIHSRESKYDKQCCSCWANCKTDDHLLQCPKRKRHQSEIFQAITRLGKEMDQVLHDILRDGLGKYLYRREQTTYNEAGLANSGKYWQLQKNQKEIGWDNLIGGKYSKHWRIIQHDFTKKNQDNIKLQDMKNECKRTV